MTRGSRGWVVILAFLGALLLASAASAATIRVTTTADPAGGGDCATTDHSCSLRQAIGAAATGDTVSLPAGAYKLTQSSVGLLNITAGITLAGAGARTTTIEQTVANENVLNISSGVSATIQGVKITGGDAGGGLSGGGINSAGTLALKDVAVTGNKDLGYTFSFCSPPPCLNFPEPGVGGGISETGGALSIIDSTISGNSAQAGGGKGATGGGIYSNGPVTVVNSTIAGNSAQGGSGQGQGGGILMSGGASPTLTLANATIALNSASGPSSGGGAGGNVYLAESAGTVNSAVKNSVIADGTAAAGGENCAGGVLTSEGYNLEDRRECGLTGTGDIHPSNAKLSSLNNHGGPTDTVALTAGSPAINAGNPSGCQDASAVTLLTDQRGITRPQGTRCDIGAFEFRVPSLKGSPRISGTPRVGQKLTCVFAVQSPDGPTINTVTWLRNGATAGTGATYVVKSSDAGHSVSCHIVATNTAGSASATSRPVSVPVPPTVSITSSNVNGHRASFKFTMHNATGAQCALAKGHNQLRFSSCTSPKSYSGLAKGSYTFSVRAVGPGGVSAPTRFTFNIA